MKTNSRKSETVKVNRMIGKKVKFKPHHLNEDKSLKIGIILKIEKHPTTNEFYFLIDVKGIKYYKRANRVVLIKSKK